MNLHVLASYVIVWLADPTPSPTPGEFTGNEDAVTPGVVGFIATFFIAALTVLLLVDMTRRVRRVRYRAEIQEKLEAEAEAEAKGEEVSSAPEG
ncbi:MAG: hypothetical protein JWR04_1251 [Rhodoglobus sp.]|nr:hypothetical protein [Rhodoglobus sp.]